MTPVTVLKLNPEGEETWRYSGTLLERGDTWLTLEARFNRDDLPFHGIVLARGDRFVETYYTDRWYNIFEIHGRDDDRLKGWYCNIACPACIEANALRGGWLVSYKDLALDLWVYADGKQLVLDEDEFAALDLSPAMAGQARQALASLQAEFAARSWGPARPAPTNASNLQ